MRPKKPIAWRTRLPASAARRAALKRRYFDVPRLSAPRNPFRPDLLDGVNIFAPSPLISPSDASPTPRRDE